MLSLEDSKLSTSTYSDSNASLSTYRQALQSYGMHDLCSYGDFANAIAQTRALATRGSIYLGLGF